MFWRLGNFTKNCLKVGRHRRWPFTRRKLVRVVCADLWWHWTAFSLRSAGCRAVWCRLRCFRWIRRASSSRSWPGWRIPCDGRISNGSPSSISRVAGHLLASRPLDALYTPPFIVLLSPVSVVESMRYLNFSCSRVSASFSFYFDYFETLSLLLLFLSFYDLCGQMGTGLASMMVPMYLAETSSASERGLLVTLNVMFITGGQAAAAVFSGFLSRHHDGWRYVTHNNFSHPAESPVFFSEELLWSSRRCNAWNNWTIFIKRR